MTYVLETRQRSLSSWEVLFQNPGDATPTSPLLAGKCSWILKRRTERTVS